MSTFRQHEAIAIAEAWLKGETCRNPDEMVNEQRMAAYLLLAIQEIDRLTRERDEAREAAKQLLGQTATFVEENEAIAKYPWLDYHA
jgi:hypothetical protein